MEGIQCLRKLLRSLLRPCDFLLYQIHVKVTDPSHLCFFEELFFIDSPFQIKAQFSSWISVKSCHFSAWLVIFPSSSRDGLHGCCPSEHLQLKQFLNSTRLEIRSSQSFSRHMVLLLTRENYTFQILLLL